MAQSYVPFNDNASASRKFHTFQRSNGTDTVEQYVQVVGAPYLPTYAITTSTAPIVSANDEGLLQIMAGASLRVRLLRLEIYQIVAATTTTVSPISIRRVSSVGTGGNTETVVPMDPADAAAGCTAKSAMSTTGTQGSILWFGTYMIHQTVATVGQQKVLDVSWDYTHGKGPWIPTGTSNGLVVMHHFAASPAQVYITATVVESPEGA